MTDEVRTSATPEDMRAALQLAVRYLDHPGVQAIPFARSAESVATLIHELLAR